MNPPSLQRHQICEEVVQLLYGQLVREVLRHHGFLLDDDFVQVSFQQRMKLAVLFAELNAEIGLVDAKTYNDASRLRDLS